MWLFVKAMALKDQLVGQFEQVNGVNFLATQVDLSSADAVKSLAYALKAAVDNVFIVLGQETEGKPGLTIVISESLVSDKGLNASTIVRELAKEIQGGGGGQPFFATAGGKNAAGLSAALAKAKEFLPHA
jgi:alanyl-tRNA synthetase